MKVSFSSSAISCVVESGRNCDSAGVTGGCCHSSGEDWRERETCSSQNLH